MNVCCKKNYKNEYIYIVKEKHSHNKHYKYKRITKLHHRLIINEFDIFNVSDLQFKIWAKQRIRRYLKLTLPIKRMVKF